MLVNVGFLIFLLFIWSVYPHTHTIHFTFIIKNVTVKHLMALFLLRNVVQSKNGRRTHKHVQAHMGADKQHTETGNCIHYVFEKRSFS
jgi:hypothetical protein